jgi:two-component system, cell cycle sensor histidine kinase and response regulator CckA
MSEPADSFAKKTVAGAAHGREYSAAGRGDLLTKLAGLVPGVIYQYQLYPDGRSAFPYSSPGMVEIYEVTPEEVRVDATPVFGRLHPEDHGRVAQAIWDSARTLETFHCEFRVQLPRQGLRWRWSQAHPERTADGGTLWHGIILDITDKKLAEEERERLAQQLNQAQKMESIGQLAGGVAHDFNNLLTVINGYSKMLLDGMDAADPVAEGLSEIYRSGQRAAALTRQLLAFSRNQVIQPRVLDLTETVLALRTMLNRLVGEDVEIRCGFGPSAATVLADPHQIEQVLMNLAVNARDAMPKGGVLEIESDVIDVINVEAGAPLPWPRPGEYCLLRVRDNGEGMEESTRARVFEPFFTTKRAGLGTGLGLSTVQDIMTRCGGFITVDSQPGAGSTFTVYVPKTAAPEPSPEPSTPAALSAVPQGMIVVVEDQPEVRRYVVTVLRSRGFKVVEAENVREALRLCNEHSDEVRLVVTDVIMPEASGRQLVDQLAVWQPRIKALFMSGYTDDVIVQHRVFADLANFIQKPFTPGELISKVLAVMG